MSFLHVCVIILYALFLCIDTDDIKHHGNNKTHSRSDQIRSDTYEAIHDTHRSSSRAAHTSQTVYPRTQINTHMNAYASLPSSPSFPSLPFPSLPPSPARALAASASSLAAQQGQQDQWAETTKREAIHPLTFLLLRFLPGFVFRELHAQQLGREPSILR